MASVAAEQFPVAENEAPYLSERAYIQNPIDDFRHHYQDLHEVSVRAPLALTLVNELRSAEGQTEAVTPPQTLEQLRTKTQLDMVEWLAWNNLWLYHDQPQIQLPGTLEPQNIRQSEFAAKEQLFEDICKYDAQVDHEQAYGELLDNLYLSRLVVKNPGGLLGLEKKLDKGMLEDILAVHKVIKGLHHSGFTRTRRSGLSEKNHKIDIVVPVGRPEAQRLVAIHLQRGSRGASLNTQILNKILLVDLPNSKAAGTPFDMTDIDRAILRRGVKGMRASLLPILSLAAEGA